MCISALGLRSISNPFSHDIEVVDTYGNKKFFDPKFVLKMIDKSCADLSDSWKIEQLYSRIEASIFGGITEGEIVAKTLDAAAFYAMYDPEFKVVSKKLSKRLKSDVRITKKEEIKLQGFSNLL